MGVNYIHNFIGEGDEFLNYCQLEPSRQMDATVTVTTMGRGPIWVFALDDSPLEDSAYEGLFAQYQLRDRNITFGEFVDKSKWAH